MSTSPPPASLKRPPRFAEWFWRGDALRAARSPDDARRAALFCEQRARIAAEVAQRTLEPSAPWQAGEAEHLAAALFAESIGWSLRLAGGKTAALASSRPADRDELAQLVEAEHGRLLAAAGDDGTASRVSESLLERRFETQTLSKQAVEQAARELESVANALLRTLAPSRAAEETVLLQRAARLGVLALALAALLLGFLDLRARLERKWDLARGKAWTASSQLETACASPQQECETGKSFFFHTREERNAWVEIDLAKSERVSKIRVLNRPDCCAERAVPLIVEVSNDRNAWQEVARRKEVFEEWTAKFPSVTARYVRLRVARRTILHLKEVHVF